MEVAQKLSQAYLPETVLPSPAMIYTPSSTPTLNQCKSCNTAFFLQIVHRKAPSAMNVWGTLEVFMKGNILLQ